MALMHQYNKQSRLTIAAAADGRNSVDGLFRGRVRLRIGTALCCACWLQRAVNLSTGGIPYLDKKTRANTGQGFWESRLC